MRPDELAKRLRWFDDGVAALRRVISQPPLDAYCCPLCLRGFCRDAVAAGVLSVEHVPARSVGGRGILLTCRACNNHAGAELESKLKLADAVARFGTADSVPIPAEWTIGGRVNRGMTRFDGTTFEHFGIPKRNDQRDLAHFESDLQQLGDGSEIRVTISHEPDVMSSAARAWTRSAYLAAFAVLGYRYILRSSLTSVRDAIEGRKPTAVTKLASDHGLGILRIDSPDNFAGCLAVVQHRTLSLLPGFSTAGERLVDEYQRLRSVGAPALPLLWSGGWDWPVRAMYRADE